MHLSLTIGLNACNEIDIRKDHIFDFNFMFSNFSSLKLNWLAWFLHLFLYNLMTDIYTDKSRYQDSRETWNKPHSRSIGIVTDRYRSLYTGVYILSSPGSSCEWKSSTHDRKVFVWYHCMPFLSVFIAIYRDKILNFALKTFPSCLCKYY